MSRQTVHAWLARYEAEGLEGLTDRSHRTGRCPHQMPAAVEAAVPRSPTTTGKIERLHRSMRAEFRAVAKHFTSAGPVVMSTLMGIYCGSL